MRFFYTLAVVCIFVTACSDNPTSTKKEDKGEHYALNNWIRGAMDYYYFWNERVPEETNGFVTPEDFFQSMIDPSDIFSHISDDAETYMNSVEGSAFTAGFSPTFVKFANSNDVFIVIRYVYPNSPASDAGIDRGDIILKINGQQLTTENYLDLYYAEGTSGTLTFGVLDTETNSISEGETINIIKEQLDLNPIVHTEIFKHDGQKTGYIFYTQFVDGPEDIFVDALNDTLSGMLAEGISDLIIDLRYNPGGTISTAQAFGNAIAPLSATINEDVFVTFQYNENLEQEFIEEEGMDSENLAIRFSEGPVNLDLDKIYFLTSGSSASASELLINGLSPYLDVVQIGLPTYGKYYGAYVIPNKTFNYAIIPVTMKYANALGVTDFVNGLQPDYEAEEELMNLIALGDESDPLLGKALELITGEAMPVAKAPAFSIPHTILENPVELQKGNVLFSVKK